MEIQLEAPRDGARAVVVHPYGESAQGMFVTRRLVACGYAVVPSHGAGLAVLAQVAGSFPALPVAQVGEVREALALAKAAAGLQRRVSAMVAIGGPLALLLEEPDGLEVPTLVVSDVVNRALRRRARRRLPRGSRVVRATDFDAALREVVEFLDLRTATQAVRRRPARRRAGRLVPAALLASPAAMLAIVPPANAAADCTDVVDGDTLFITCEGDGAAQFELGVSEGGQILVNKVAKASVSDIAVVKVISKATNTLMLMNEQDHKFGTGLGTPDDPFVAVKLDVDLGGVDDTLAWLATSGVDQFKLFTDALDVTGDSLADHKVLGIETLKLDLLAGNDLLAGGEWQSKIIVDGGLDDDVLIGGVSDDSFKLSAGKDVLDGAGGLNDLKLFSDDSQVKISDSLVMLADEGSETSFKEFVALSYLGGALDSKVELAGIKLLKVDLDLGDGVDSLKVSTDDSLVRLTESKIELADALLTFKYDGAESLSYLGGDADNKVEVLGFKLQKLDLDGGAGLNEMKLTSDDGLVTIGDSLIKLSEVGSEVAFKQFVALSYLGGALDSKVELAGIKLQKVDLDLGDGVDSLKVSTDDSLVRLTESKIELTDALLTFKYDGAESLSYLGGDADNKVEVLGFKLQKLDLDGGAGLNEMKLTSDDGLVTIGDSLIKLSEVGSEVAFKQFVALSYLGGALDSKVELAGIKLQKVDLDLGDGVDSLKVSTDDSLVRLTESKIELADALLTFKYDGAESLSYLGGDADNKVEVLGFKLQKLDLDGGAGLNEMKLTSDDSLVTIGDSLIKLSEVGSEVAFKQFVALSYLGGALDSKVELAGIKLQKVDVDLGDGVDYLKLSTDDSSVKLSDALIELSDANASFKYSGAESLAYVGGVSDNKVDVSGIKLQKLDLDAAGGADLLTVSSNESLFKFTDASLTLGANASIGHKAFESLAAFGGESANKIDGSLVAGLKLSFDGGGGNDVLLGGALADVLFGKLGNDVLSGGLGDDKLGGGLGNDQVSGDGGFDTLFDEGDVNFTVTSTGLSGLGTDVLKGIEGLYLVGGAHDNVFDATKFKLGPVTMDGGEGDDVLLGSPQADKLVGSLGDDRLTGNQGNDSLHAGFGDDYLDGSTGTDFGDGGPGFDTGKSIEIRVNLEK